MQCPGQPAGVVAVTDTESLLQPAALAAALVGLGFTQRWPLIQPAALATTPCSRSSRLQSIPSAAAAAWQLRRADTQLSSRDTGVGGIGWRDKHDILPQLMKYTLATTIQYQRYRYRYRYRNRGGLVNENTTRVPCNNNQQTRCSRGCSTITSVT